MITPPENQKNKRKNRSSVFVVYWVHSSYVHMMKRKSFVCFSSCQQYSIHLFIISPIITIIIIINIRFGLGVLHSRDFLFFFFLGIWLPMRASQIRSALFPFSQLSDLLISFLASFLSPRAHQFMSPLPFLIFMHLYVYMSILYLYWGCKETANACKFHFFEWLHIRKN